MITPVKIARSWWPAVACYAILSAAWIGTIQIVKRSALEGTSAWALEHVVPATLTLWVTWLIARRVAPGNAAGLMSLGRPAPLFMWIALVASLPALAVAPWHADWQAWLLTPKAAALCFKIALNQGLLEEWLARGLLLGWLVRLGATDRRALWLSALAFGGMHMLQFLVPPYTTERLVNGLVLVALTIPIGALLAWFTMRARSIWPAVTFHFLTDLTILPQELTTPNHLAILLGAIGANLLAALLLYAHLRRRHTRAPDPSTR